MIVELERIAQELKDGDTPQPVTVRTFLWWFGYQRRRQGVVVEIREQLSNFGIVTVPDFEDVWVDSPIAFALKRPEPLSSDAIQPNDVENDSPSSAVHNTSTANAWVSREATYRVSRLAAANQGVVSIAPDGTLTQAVTTMMARGFSQLPVMTNERTVKGMLSWRSIGARLALGTPVKTATEAMEQCHIVRSSDSVFDAMQAIVTHDYVLVRGGSDKIDGIVTASDLSLQFHDLTEPFLLLSEVENLVRNLIGDRYEVSELSSASDPSDTARANKIETVSDLNFGEYIRLLQKEERWAKLELAVDRVIFCQHLDEIREVRNDVMHFDPDGIEPDKLIRLREFTKFMRDLALVRNQSD
jgi:CBS domain-containing protein